MAEITTARFFRKAANVQDLAGDTPKINPTPFRVAKVVELTARQYRQFANDLLTDTPFIRNNGDLMRCDRDTGAFQCLLVTCRERKDAILINSEGYNYARYAAHIPDKQRVRLRNVPVERHGMRARENRGDRSR